MNKAEQPCGIFKNKLLQIWPVLFPSKLEKIHRDSLRKGKVNKNLNLFYHFLDSNKGISHKLD